MKIPFTELEKICKFFYEHNMDFRRFLESDEDNVAGSLFDLDQLQMDKLTYFSHDQSYFREDLIIPEDFDVMILRQARYLPVRKHSHEYVEFVYLMEGTTTEVIGDTKYRMEEGDIFLLAPGTEHYDITNNDDALLFFIMARIQTFTTAFLSLIQHDDFLSVFFSQIIFNNKQNAYMLFRTGDDQNLKHRMYELYQEFTKMDAYSSRLANNGFEWLCIHLLQHHISNIQDTTSHHSSLNLSDVLKYIEENYRTITLDDVCEKFNYSRGHIQRVFKQSTGFTFLEFVTRIKINRACKLLQNDSLTVQNIAEELGFNDDSSFYRSFKKQTGLSPSEYRKKYR